MGAVSSSLARSRSGGPSSADPSHFTARSRDSADANPDGARASCLRVLSRPSVELGSQSSRHLLRRELRSEPGWGDSDAEAAPVRPLRRHERGRGREGGRGAKATDLHEGRDGGLDRLCKIGVHTP